MKTKLVLAIALAASLLCLAQTRRPHHGVVVLQTYPVYWDRYSGMTVINASWSDGVTPVPMWDWTRSTNAPSYAQVLAELLDDGFRISNIQQSSDQCMMQTVTLTR